MDHEVSERIQQSKRVLWDDGACWGWCKLWGHIDIDGDDERAHE